MTPTITITEEAQAFFAYKHDPGLQGLIDRAIREYSAFMGGLPIDVDALSGGRLPSYSGLRFGRRRCGAWLSWREAPRIHAGMALPSHSRRASGGRLLDPLSLMAILPSDLLEQAEGLLARAERLPDIPERETLLRTCVSRAYYAAFHEALAFARREGYTRAPIEYGSHGGLWLWWFVQERPHLNLSGVGDRLREQRTRADDRLRETVSFASVRAAVADVRAAFDLVREG